jgi:hypothetical protein
MHFLTKQKIVAVISSLFMSYSAKEKVSSEKKTMIKICNQNHLKIINVPIYYKFETSFP